MEDPIEQYLREYGSAGTKDSTGAFTIAADKALSKLAAFQLPRPAAWLLKMVQAGVAAGASSIAVSQSAKSSRIVYHGGDFGGLKELVGLITDPHAMVTPTQQHLLIGLRAVALGRKRPVLLVEETADGHLSSAFWNHGSVSPLRVDGRTLALPGRRRAEASLSIHVADTSLTAGNTLKREKGIKRTVAEEYRELMTNAVVCPIPLTVDGRAVNHFGLGDASFHRSPLVFGGVPAEEREPPSVPLSASLVPEGVEQGNYRHAWTIYLLARDPRANELCWVKDGVICHTERLHQRPAPFFVRLFLSAQDLETDLTGLQPRFENPEQPKQRIHDALRDLAERAPAIANSKMEPVGTKLTSSRSGAWWGSAMLLAGGILLSPVTPLGATLSLAGIAGLSGSSLQSQAQKKTQISKLLPSWAAEIEQNYRDRALGPGP